MNETYSIILIIIIIILPLFAQSKVNSNYNKYSKIKNSLNITGEEVAKRILNENNLTRINVYRTGGILTDHYDPTKKIINLSDSIYSSTSIAAIAVAAHECGHAIQDKESYAFLRFRSKMVPVVNFTSRLSSIILFLGIILGALDFINLALLLLCVGLFFQLITLPVEFDASRRAKQELEKIGLIEHKDKKGIEKVLSAAAFTYVASFLATALQILRLFLATRNDRH